MAQNDLIAAFVAPPSRYRGKLFWAWNGPLQQNELLRQIKVMHQMGEGGFFMHSRTGLATEYLGEQWFALVNACADEAERLGMEAWLYDEDRWPSGTAGGKVTANPRYRTKYLRMTALPAADFRWDDARWQGHRPELGLVAAFVCELDELVCTNVARITQSTALNTLAGHTVLVCTTEEMAEETFYNGQTYVDALNHEATAAYLRITHEAYKEHCGDRLGRSIKGIFTDEPHHGMVMEQRFGLGNPDPEWLVPWTYDFFEEFERRIGYNLVDRLPELFLHPDGRPVSEVKWHYNEVLEQLFLERWAAPIHTWCREHDLILTGHVMQENSLTGQTVPCGSVMRYYEHMDYPGIDILTEHNRMYWVAKQLQSAARQLGRAWRLSELYGCTGWQMTFEDHKAMGDWQALLGINVRCKHLGWYTMAGEAKRDYPASILHQSTWFAEYEKVETYFSRIHVLMSQGQRCCDLLILNPVESAWARVHPGHSLGMACSNGAFESIEDAFADLCRWLMGAQIDFDYGDEDYLKRMGVVVSQGGLPELHVGKAAYRAVLVPPMLTVRATTLALLEQFADMGGSVIFAGQVPPCVDARTSPRAQQLADRTNMTRLSIAPVVKACEVAVERVVLVSKRDADKPLDAILCQVRRHGETVTLMAINTDRDHAFHDVRVRLKAQGAVEQWDCLSGERYRIDAQECDGWLEFQTDFAPAGEALFRIVPQHDDGITPRPRYTEEKRRPISGPFLYTLDEPNCCVLDQPRYRLDTGPWRAPLEVIHLDRAIREELGMPQRNGRMLQPWYANQHAYQARAHLSLAFDVNIQHAPQTPVELAIEAPDNFTITVNGHTVTTHNDPTWWIDPAFQRVALPGNCLQTGLNTVMLTVDFHEGIDLEAIYLLGDFGVRIDGPACTITSLPETLDVGDVVSQGLPFYTGRICYRIPPETFPAGNGEVFVAAPDFAGACLQATCAAAEPKTMPWRPYETDVTEWVHGPRDFLDIEVVLTRRNVFGPLHQKPLKAPNYGPGSFRSTGDNFTSEYMLYPSGLLGDLQWAIRHRE